MYGAEIRRTAMELARLGEVPASIGRKLGVSRSAIREWLADPVRALASGAAVKCFACAYGTCPHPEAYAYRLGQYLGDGYLVTSARIPRLRISCATAYPAIAAEVDAAMAVLSGNRTGAVALVGCHDRYCYWNHWPCLFPQHGQGRKHERPIVLVRWQRDIIAEHPWPLIRGLIHSDGSRATNRVRVNGKTYAYPRYFFSNESRDILGIMGDALDRVGVAWRYNRPNSIAIARRAAVETMDAHVGPKE
jgi:hypothetical protein